MKSIFKGRLMRFVFILTIFGLLLQPVQQTLAAEQFESDLTPLSTSGPTAPESETVEEVGDLPESETQEDSIDLPNESEELESGEKEDQNGDSEEADQADTSENGIPAPPLETNIQLPPSTVKQKTADADVASGALTYNHTLQIPAGRKGVQPDLALKYNSQLNEEGSIVGYGWNLDIPTIERKNIDGVNKLYEQENFTASLSGDLKKISSSGGVSNFGAKIDNGSYLKYMFQSNADNGGGAWIVTDKTGMVYTYGAVAAARLNHPADATKVFRWYLTKVQDANGNFISYEYTKVNNQVYPSVIKYTGHGVESGIFKVEFILENRPDPILSAKYGFLVKNTKRIAEVKTFIQTTLVGVHHLEYEQQSVNNRSQLVKAEYIGYDAAGQSPIPDGGMQFEYASVGATDLLTKIVQNTGGITEVTYKSSTQYRNAQGGAFNPGLPFSVQTVEKIKYDDRNGVEWENSFTYAGGWFYYNGPMDRRFVGFEQVVRTDSVGNQMTTFYHQGNESNTSFGEFEDDWAKAGKSYKSELRDSAGNLFAQTFTKWEFNRLPGVNGSQDRSFVKLAAMITRLFDGNASHKDTASTYEYDEETGNIINAIDFGEVNATETGSFADIGTDKLITTVTYADPSVNEHIIGLVSGFTEKNQDNVKVKEGRTYYDDLALGQVGIGNATKKDQWVNGSTFASVTSTYNSYGLPRTETDPRGNITTYAYDSFSMYPASVTNALSHVVQYEYDYRLGQPFKTTDSNSLVIKMSYDGLGRVIKEEFTKPGQSNPNVLYATKNLSYELYQQGGEVRGWKTTQIAYLDNADTSTPREHISVTYTDGFDRTIQVRTLVEAVDATPSEPRYSVLDTVYNTISQIGKTSLPYFSAGSDRTAIQQDATLFVNLTYDPMYRIVQSTNAVGSTTNTYDDWKIIVTDANSKIKELYKDAFNRLEKVKEHNGSEVYVTEYEYDAANNLIRIEDALGNEREFKYDGLNRRTEAEDLHASNDSTFGVWNYTYDLAGNLAEQTDANGVTVGYTYDALNRITAENANKDKTVEVSYGYDTCVKGVGRLCTVVNADLTTANEYNTLGQLIKETKTINNQAYVTEYGYDRQGNQTFIKNPDNSEIKHVYNIGNALESVQSKESGASSFGNVVTDIDYAPTGAVTYLQHSNGGITTNTYDATKIYRLSKKVGTLPLTGGGIKTVQDYSYTYDPVGNITQIDDVSELNTRKTVKYWYDDLNRLISTRSYRAVGGSNFIINYTYDAIGNIISKSDSGTYTYDGDQGGSYANPHAVTSVTNVQGTHSYTYDKNGNMLTGDGKTIEWDYNNRIRDITLNGLVLSPVNYGYDAFGMRVKVATNNTTTVYPSKSFNTSGAASGSGVQKHVFAGDSLAATIKGSGASATFSALHNDHLGSTIVVSDSAGAIAETVDYFPFGSIRQNTVSSGTPEQRKYIGQEYDVESGLSYLEARYYNSNSGRFLSQDIVHLSLGDPQAIKEITDQEMQIFLSDPQNFNSYSYARNNPILLKDPSGEFWGQIGTFLSKAGYAISNTFQKSYQQRSWTNPITKLGSYILADAFKQQGVALDKNAATVARGVAAISLGSNFLPQGKAIKVYGPLKESILLERAAIFSQAASTGDSEVVKIVEKLYQVSDDVPGGTAGALMHEMKSGQMLSRSLDGHLTAAKDRVNWINNQLNRIGNSNAKAVQVLQTLRQDLERAIYSRNK